jgi:hypothetical protein
VFRAVAVGTRIQIRQLKALPNSTCSRRRSEIESAAADAVRSADTEELIRMCESTVMDIDPYNGTVCRGDVPGLDRMTTFGVAAD